MDESYEWDAEVTLATDLLAALQLYRTAEPPRPLSTIALRDLERQKPGGGGSTPVTSVSAEALVAAGGPPPHGRHREGAQQRRRQRPGGGRGGCGERCELATLL